MKVMMEIEDVLMQVDPAPSGQRLRDHLLTKFTDNDLPSTRTLQDIIKEREVPDDTGPWTLTSDYVDVDHIPLVMPVLRAVVENTKGVRKGITNAEAACVVRILRAAPDLGPWNAFQLAQFYIRRNTHKESTLALDLQLAFRPWADVEETAHYSRCISNGWVPEPPYFFHPTLNPRISAVSPTEPPRSSAWPTATAPVEEGQSSQ